MADVDTGDVLRLGAMFQHNTTTIIANTFHVRVTAGGGLDFSDSADDISEYLEDIYDGLKIWLSDEQASWGISLANLTQDTTYGLYNWGTPVNGSNAGPWLPQGIAMLTWGRTNKPRVQTRKYWGVFTESGIDDGEFVSSVQTVCAAAHLKHHTSFVGTNGLTVLGVAYNRTLGTWTDVRDIASTTIPAYQRRRRLGRGS